jgi:erythromycin esterase
MGRGDQHAMMLDRDAAIADTVEWILARETRILLGAHNGHLLRCPGTLPGIPPITPMGMHLADRLGTDYLVIGMTTGTGEMLNTAPDFYEGKLFTPMDTPEPDTLDALMQASHTGPFAVDLRKLDAADAAAVAAAPRQRFGTYYAEQDHADAYDLLIHLPHVSAALPDQAAVAAASEEERRIFARWLQHDGA